MDQLVLFRDANHCWSRTAATMIAPLATACVEVSRLLRVNTFVRVVKMSTPKTVPTTVPRPPLSSVPPMTTAAIASSSSSWPCVEDPVVVRATMSRAPMAQQTRGYQAGQAGIAQQQTQADEQHHLGHQQRAQARPIDQ